MEPFFYAGGFVAGYVAQRAWNQRQRRQRELVAAYEQMRENRRLVREAVWQYEAACELFREAEVRVFYGRDLGEPQHEVFV